MKRFGISYRITASLIITALLTAGLSIFLFYGLTKQAFTNYVTQSQLKQGQELSLLLGNVYDQSGWNGVQTIISGQAMMRQRPNNGNMHGGGKGWKAKSTTDFDIVVTDLEGNIVASTKDVEDISHKSTKKLQLPIYSGNKHIGNLTMQLPISPVEESLENVFSNTISKYSFLAIIFGVFVALIAGIIISNKLVKPIKQLSSAVRLFALGKRDVGLKVESEDELGALANNFNIMADKIKTSETLRKNLTADVAHELRTPLSIMSGTLESIQAGIMEPTVEVLLSLQDETVRMSRLIKDLSDLSSVEAGSLTLNRVEIYPFELKDKFSYFEFVTNLKGIEFVLDIPEDLPKISVDVIRIVQVITNLLNNALSHTKSGKIGLIALKAEDGVLFSVKDTGSGIEPKDIPHVFERFYRSEKSRSRKTGGMGLGLSIAKGLVEAHGGKMWVESCKDVGTEFKFIIPAA
ncbi:MAG TPA: HAMP domain-containing histidine kinase [Thermoanaerobacterales bacterium]|nr:HAMP domain-containing histidine kinase [Thermoanaerobacterales bacterium]